MLKTNKENAENICYLDILWTSINFKEDSVECESKKKANENN